MLGLPAEQPAKKQLASPVDRLLRDLAELLHDMIVEVLQSSRTRDDFATALKTQFPVYVGLVCSFAEIVSSRASTQAIERLSLDSLLEFEADLRANGYASFGPEMTERALFTVSTLRRITSLLSRMIASQGNVDDGDSEKDKDYRKNFLLHALVSRFCVDCLVVAMQTRQPIYPEVLKQMDDYLRSAVDAYAWIRRAADLRLKKAPRPAGPVVPLDAEEQQLLNESMIDLAHGSI
jgi:hypothetical protein